MIFIIYPDLPRDAAWMMGGGPKKKKKHPLGFKQHPLEDTGIRTQCMYIYIDMYTILTKIGCIMPMKFTLILQKLHQRWMVPWWNITQTCRETTSCSKPLLGFQFPKKSFPPKRIRYASSNYERQKHVICLGQRCLIFSLHKGGRAKNLNASLPGWKKISHPSPPCFLNRDETYENYSIS